MIASVQCSDHTHTAVAFRPIRIDEVEDESNAAPLTKFFAELEATLDRQIEQIILIPLHGHQNEFISVDEAIDFVSHHQSSNHFDGAFRKYEIIVKYTNGDKIEADFQDKKRAIDFLHYVQEGSAS